MSAGPFERREGGILFSDDPALVDLDVVHGFLSTSYWSPGIPRRIIERAIRHSLVFGVYDTLARRADADLRPAQIGFARVVTDRATFAYLADVFILEPFRGRGLSKGLVAFVMSHPDLQGLRRFMLATRDAHGLYARSGFTALTHPERFMEKADPDIYRRITAPGADT